MGFLCFGNLVLTGLILCAGFRRTWCHRDLERIMDKIRNKVDQMEIAHENIWNGIEELETVLENDIKAAGLGSHAGDEEPGFKPARGKTSMPGITDREVVVKQRLDALEQTISALEHFVYHENSARKRQLRDLSGPTGESFDAKMESVKRMTDEMIEEVDTTLAGVRKEIKETESTANARNVIVGDLLYYQGIGSACNDWYDSCRVPDSECRDEKCQCIPGLSYDSLRQQCVEECPYGYGNTYQSVNNYIIRGFNDIQLNETTLDECKRICETDQSFECRSLDYFPDYTTCYLSNTTKLEADIWWEYNGVGVHLQRDCIYDRY